MSCDPGGGTAKCFVILTVSCLGCLKIFCNLPSHGVRLNLLDQRLPFFPDPSFLFLQFLMRKSTSASVSTSTGCPSHTELRKMFIKSLLFNFQTLQSYLHVRTPCTFSLTEGIESVRFYSIMLYLNYLYLSSANKEENHAQTECRLVMMM